MKRKINLILLLILGVGPFIKAIQVRLPNLAGVVGDTLTVPLYVDDDLTANNVVAYQFIISYSSSNIKFLGATTSGTISSGFNELMVRNGTDYSTIVGAGSLPLTGKGILLNIKIVLIGSGTYMQFQNGVTSNFFNEGNPVLTFTNGYISISAKPLISVSPANGIFNIGEIQQFNSSGGTAPYTWSVSDNTIAAITSDGKLTVLKNGMVKVIAIDSKGYRGESGNMDCRSFRATLRDTAFYQNNIIDIPLKFNDLDGTLLYAGKFVFSFNESILSFDSLITTNSILDGIASIQYQKQTGKAIIAFAAPKSIVTSGTLFKLRFKIADISSGATYITFDEATINETLSPKFRNGYFSITPLPSLSLTSPGLAEMYTGEKKQYTVTGGTAPYKWSVENTTFATINNTGNLSGISGGSTKVIVKDSYGSQASSNITIFDSWVNVRDSSAVVNNWVLLLPVDLGLNTNKGVLSISGSASCPSGKIDSIQVLNSGTLTQNWQLANKTGTNQANFAMSSAVPLVSGGKIINFKIYFKHTLQIGDVFYVNCNNLLLNEGAPNAKVKSGSVTIKNLFTGIEDIPLSVISVSPIPVTNELFIKMNPEFASSVISVVDLSGKTILTRTLANFDGSQFMLPVQSLAEGFYFLKLQSQKSNAVLKFIKR